MTPDHADQSLSETMAARIEIKDLGDPTRQKQITDAIVALDGVIEAKMPELDVDFINEPDPHMPELGARGIGEIGIVGAPAAVANAIFNATGKRVRDLPITPDKLI